jgi:dinuclear metal center YbgI/SA1388 family protein
MVELAKLVDYCDERLAPATFDDYCPNGLQVEAGSGEVRMLVTGVTASLALIEAAAEQGADLLLVHHGYFWKGEPLPLTGTRGRRVRRLFEAGMSLLAYHLPLDAHPELGNNRQLGLRLGVTDAAPLDGGLVWRGMLREPLPPAAFARRVAEALGREPLHVGGGGAAIRSLAWCTGGAQGFIEQAAAAGCDAYLSGEISEPTFHAAHELGLHYFAAGHHATERYGVQALGDELAGHFGVEHTFVDIHNPV